jgi:hypothetical protein
VAKHRRAPAPTSRARRQAAGRDRRLPDPLPELLLWAAVGCVLVPLVLVWSGAGWPRSLGVGGLLLGLVAVCLIAVVLSGRLTGGPDKPDAPPASPAVDDRGGPREATGP